MKVRSAKVVKTSIRIEGYMPGHPVPRCEKAKQLMEG